MIQDQDGNHQLVKGGDGGGGGGDDDADAADGQQSYSSPKCPISWKLCVGFIAVFLCIILILVHYKNIVELFKD